MTSIWSKFSGFLADESGSVIIDWVVITGATVGISLFMFDGVSTSVLSLASDVEAQLLAIEIPTTFRDYASLK